MRAAFLAGACLLAFPGPARAETEIHLGTVDSAASGRPRWTLGLAPLAPKDPRSPDENESARRLREVLRSDLLFSRYFDLIEQAPPADLPDAEAVRQAWRARGAPFLLEGEVSRVDDELTLTLRLVDLGSGDALLSRFYRQKEPLWRSLAHKVSDDVVRQLTGKRGIAQSRIAFVSDHGGNKELHLVDYDSAGLKKLTSNGSLNLLPRFSPDGRSLVFTSYKEGNPDLFLYDLAGGKLRALSGEQGLNLAGGFSPDGARVAATLSRGSNPNIYIIAVVDGAVSRATDHRGVEASPTFSPDGQQLAFVSDRSGNPQIHTLEIPSGRTRKLTQMNWCDSPAWSPTGEWIAFAGRAHRKDSFDIFLVDVTGNRVIQLTHGEGSNEEPSWSPDGRFLAFTTTRNKRRQIYLMDADGSAPRALGEIPGNAFTPSWGS